MDFNELQRENAALPILSNNEFSKFMDCKELQ